jgi:crotonobetainyl-CoA:carnitine CoA-transferase CaiB-like acyl-CoA transferase
MSEVQTPLLLEHCRVLDLTEFGYRIAGKILGDLGADVIQLPET